MKLLLKGRVIKGDGLGRKLGYPTANLDKRYFNKHPVPSGVYTCWVRVFKKVRTGRSLSVQAKKRRVYKGIAIVGAKRVKKQDSKIEVYILDFHKNIYHWYLQAEVIKKLRSMKKFQGSPALIRQIRNDIVRARCIFSLTYNHEI